MVFKLARLVEYNYFNQVDFNHVSLGFFKIGTVWAFRPSFTQYRSIRQAF